MDLGDVLARSDINLSTFQAAARARYANPELGRSSLSFVLPSFSSALANLACLTSTSSETQYAASRPYRTFSSLTKLSERDREAIEATLLARPSSQKPLAVEPSDSSSSVSFHSLAGMDKLVDPKSGLGDVSLDEGLIMRLRGAYSKLSTPRPIGRSVSRERPPLSVPTSSSLYPGEWTADGSAASASASVTLGNLDTWLPPEALAQVLALTVGTTGVSTEHRERVLKDLPKATEIWLEKREKLNLGRGAGQLLQQQPLFFGEVVDAYLALCLNDQPPPSLLQSLDENGSMNRSEKCAALPSEGACDQAPEVAPEASETRQLDLDTVVTRRPRHLEFLEGVGIGRRGSASAYGGKPVIAGVTAIDTESLEVVRVLPPSQAVAKPVKRKVGGGLPPAAPVLNPLLAGRPTR